MIKKIYCKCKQHPQNHADASLTKGTFYDNPIKLPAALSDPHKPDRLFHDGNRQAKSAKTHVENLGTKPVSGRNPRRFCGNPGWHVYVPAQNQALVFCGRHAADSDPAGRYRRIFFLPAVSDQKDTV